MKKSRFLFLAFALSVASQLRASETPPLVCFTEDPDNASPIHLEFKRTPRGSFGYRVEGVPGVEFLLYKKTGGVNTRSHIGSVVTTMSFPRSSQDIWRLKHKKDFRNATLEILSRRRSLEYQATTFNLACASDLEI